MKKPLITLLIIFLCTFSRVYADTIDDTAVNLAHNIAEFTVNTSDMEGHFREVFNRYPQLLFYYKSAEYATSIAGTTKVKMEYINTDNKEVAVAQSIDELVDILAESFLYGKPNADIVLINGANAAYDLSEIIEKVRDKSYISFMGYRSIQQSTHSLKLSPHTVLHFDIEYYYDSNTLIGMKQELEAKVNELASTLFAKDMPDYYKEKVIHDYLINNSAYGNFSAEQLSYVSHMAYGPLIAGKGVCEGYATAAKVLFDAAGIENRLVTGVAKGEDHMWNLVKIQNNWYHLDITWDDPTSPYGFDVLLYDFFNLTDSEIIETHSIITSNLPKCTSSELSYSNAAALCKKVNPDEFTFAEASIPSLFADGATYTADTDIKELLKNEPKSNNYLFYYKICSDIALILIALSLLIAVVRTRIRKKAELKRLEEYDEYSDNMLYEEIICQPDSQDAENPDDDA